MHKAIVNIRFTSNWIGVYHGRQLENFGLSLPQFNILRILRGAGEALSVTVVKQRMLEKSPNTTRLIDKLIEKKLVKRSRCKEDRRIVFVAIRPEGLKLLKEIDVIFDEINLDQVLTNEEAVVLNTLLDKIRGEVIPVNNTVN
jgi:DNA-binding MarR family transcriptional regulator